MAISEAIAGFGTVLQRGDGGVGAGAKAALTIGTSNQQVKYEALSAGTAGNAITVAHVNGGASQTLSVGVAGNAITVNLGTDGSSAVTSTASDVIDAIDASAAASALVNASNGTGNGSGLAVAAASAPLASGTAGTEVFTDMAEVKSISGPSMSAEVIDVTHMTSPNNTREKIGSLIDPGELTFDLNFRPNLEAHQTLLEDMRDSVISNFKLIFSNGTVWNIRGMVTGMDINAAIDDVLTSSTTITLTGFPTWD